MIGGLFGMLSGLSEVVALGPGGRAGKTHGHYCDQTCLDSVRHD